MTTADLEKLVHNKFPLEWIEARDFERMSFERATWIPLLVRKKDVRVKRTVIKLVDQLFPQNAEAGAAVEDVEVAADAHLDAGCVPAIAKIFRLRRGR